MLRGLVGRIRRPGLWTDGAYRPGTRFAKVARDPFCPLLKRLPRSEIDAAAPHQWRGCHTVGPLSVARPRPLWPVHVDTAGAGGQEEICLHN